MDVLVYGAGLLAGLVHHHVKAHLADRLTLLGFVDDAKPAGAVVVDDLKILGSLDAVNASDQHSPEKVGLVFAIGYSDMTARQGAFERAWRMGYRFEKVVHPAASIEPGVQLGEGVVVLQGAIVDQGSVIGHNTFLDAGTIVCDNCVIGSHNFIAAGTTIGGHTIIGDNNFIGLGTTIVDGVSVGNNNWINAQSLVHRRLGDDMRLIELHEQRLVEGNPL